MATEKEVQDAIANVASGNGSQRDHDLVKERSQVAGASGSQARKAQKDGAKDKSKSWGNW